MIYLVPAGERRRARETLTEREYQVWILADGQGWGRRRIAAQLNLSEARVRQLREAARNKLTK